jgi:hypothetical protein
VPGAEQETGRGEAADGAVRHAWDGGVEQQTAGGAGAAFFFPKNRQHRRFYTRR